MPARSEFRTRMAHTPVTGEDDARLARWLQPETILCDVDAHDAAALFEIAAREIAGAHGLDAGPVSRALARREQAEPTALGDGFAIPHARIAGIAEPLTLLIRLRRGIDFRAPDGVPVELFFFILVPPGEQHAHLQLLAAIAHLFCDARLRGRIAAAPDASGLADALRAGVTEIGVRG